ncbi:DeoR/GlpR family DNA-binding transcription regulator [Empedobacter brevis]|uniref:DeoR/GlpR family DNA-binding transcription regulator n=1 Tax=Empedobacter brevis TaxID=247 RepID=UPI002FE0570F
MVKEERFNIILKQLEKKNNISYETFASLLDVSEDTVRRDIDYLYRNGLLTKVRGGAMLRSKNPLSFSERIHTDTKEKDVIALKAQQFIRNGMTLFLDGGTTVCQMANYFPADIFLRIITNNPALIPIVSKMPNIELILLGGKYHTDTAITTGVNTCLEINNYLADAYFMGTCALDYLLGASSTYENDAEIKRAMIKSSKKIVVLADENKLRQTEPFKVAEIDQIDILITNLQSNDNELNDFRGIGIQIV